MLPLCCCQSAIIVVEKALNVLPLKQPNLEDGFLEYLPDHLRKLLIIKALRKGCAEVNS